MKKHQFSYKGKWYDFCIKCGNKKGADSPCTTSVDFIPGFSKHLFATIIVKGRSVGATTMWSSWWEYGLAYKCIKCNLIFTNEPHNSMAAVINKNAEIVVPYIKNTIGGNCCHPKYNIISNEQTVSEWFLPCMFTDDDVVIRDIIY